MAVGHTTTFNRPFDDFAVARYNPDGSLDTTFGVNGKVVTSLSNFRDYISRLALQKDEKIVAAGASVNDFALARYNNNGTLDMTFGSGGKVITDFAGLIDQATAVVILDNGEIVAVGSADNARKFALAYYKSDGSLDTAIGSGVRSLLSFLA